MSSSASLRPVLVVGAPFCGVGLLAHSLAQHPHLSGRLNDAHTEDFLAGVESILQLVSSVPDRGIGPIAAAMAGGDRVDVHPDIILRSVARTLRASVPIDGRPLLASPALSRHVLLLSRLLPGAHFVHLVRDVDSAVAAAVMGAAEGDPPDPGALSRGWLSSAESCLKAERILGSGTVSRVYRSDLVRDPKRSIRGVLRRIGERLSEECLWPLTLLQDDPPSSVLTKAQRRSIDPAARALSDHLDEIRPRVYRISSTSGGDPVSDALRQTTPNWALDPEVPLLSRVRRSVASLPAGSIVAVISKGDEELVSLPERQGWHFPRARDGRYAGYHPADSEEAIRHLRGLRKKGAEYLLVPEPSMWWLDYYDGFRDYLSGHPVVHRDDACVIFSLRRRGRRTPSPNEHGATEGADSSMGSRRWGHRGPMEPSMIKPLGITNPTLPLVLKQRLPGTLWVVAAYFNPARYRNKVINYRGFRDGLRSAGIPLLTVEVTFDGHSFELRRMDADMLVRLRARDVLWQKERILNLAVRYLPDECDKVAWMDADVVLTNPAWAAQTAQLLNDYQVVQPFSHCVRLRPGQLSCDPSALPFGHSENQLFYGVAFGVYAHGYRTLTNHFEHGHPGYAWAARRALLEKHGLFEMNLLGNGDTDIAQAMFGNFDYWSLQKLGPGVRSQLKEWADAFSNEVRGSVAFVPGLLTHLWHGHLKDRLYHQRLDVLQDFDPKRDVVANPETGLYEWADASRRLRDWSHDYFAARREEAPTDRVRKSASM